MMPDSAHLALSRQEIGDVPFPACWILTATLALRLGSIVFFDAPDSAAPLAWAGRGAAPAYGWVEGAGSGALAKRAWHLEPGASAVLRLVLPASRGL